MYIRTYVPEYLPDFEATSTRSFPTVCSSPASPPPTIGAPTPAEGVRETLFDESGEALSLSRSRWGEADW